MAFPETWATQHTVIPPFRRNSALWLSFYDPHAPDGRLPDMNRIGVMLFIAGSAWRG
jgi:hypothetical protein